MAKIIKKNDSIAKYKHNLKSLQENGLVVLTGMVFLHIANVPTGIKQ